MGWITLGVYFSIVIWFLLDKPIDKETPKIAADVWRINIVILAVSLGISMLLAIIFSENRAIFEIARKLSRDALFITLLIRANLLFMCLIAKLYNGEKILQPIDKFRLANLPPPYNYQLFKEEYTKWKKPN